MENVSFTYGRSGYGAGEDCLLTDITFAAGTRDKVCIMGANGAGKTTLLRLIQGGLEPTVGIIGRNAGVNLAVIPQGLSQFFTHPRLLDNFTDCGTDETEIRRFLGAALLRRDKVLEPIDNFSRGELMRAAVVKCLLQHAEFLLLDEPTSHLDIESIEVLEELLGDFHGGMLVISHDRAFVARVAETLYVLEDGRLRLC
jgi:ATP-binding cassette subfamily F protein 3